MVTKQKDPLKDYDLFYSDPKEIPDEDMFETYFEMGLSPDELDDPEEKKDHAAYLKKNNFEIPK